MAVEERVYTNAREDLARVIAQETSGINGAIPEQDDYNLADCFLAIINGELRHTVTQSNLLQIFKSIELFVETPGNVEPNHIHDFNKYGEEYEFEDMTYQKYHCTICGGNTFAYPVSY